MTKRRRKAHVAREGIFNREHSFAIVNLADDAIISIDSHQHIVLFNGAAERIFGFRADELLGTPLDLLLPDGLGERHRRHIQEFESAPESARRMAERNEVFGRRRDGTQFPAEASISKAIVNGEWLFTVILRDVTARKAAESKIRESLREKEVLLTEIHHRVKNNLQVVSSLLGLQSRVIPDHDTRNMFRESQNRIHSMALLHERLYQSENLAQIECKEYFIDVAAHLFRSYGVSTSRVKLRMDVAQARMNMDIAVPCGLILNELVSNCLKYAFPGGRAGELRIEACGDAGSLVSLTVADDGVGLPDNVKLWNAKSLGLRLVRILAEQIGATVEVRSCSGTQVTLMFAAQPCL